MLAAKQRIVSLPARRTDYRTFPRNNNWTNTTWPAAVAMLQGGAACLPMWKVHRALRANRLNWVRKLPASASNGWQNETGEFEAQLVNRYETTRRPCIVERNPAERPTRLNMSTKRRRKKKYLNRLTHRSACSGMMRLRWSLMTTWCTTNSGFAAKAVFHCRRRYKFQRKKWQQLAGSQRRG